MERASEHSQDQRHDGESRREDDGCLDAPDEVGVESPGACCSGRAQHERAPARRNEVDPKAERRFGRLAKSGGRSAARPAQERLVAEADGKHQEGQHRHDRD